MAVGNQAGMLKIYITAQKEPFKQTQLPGSIAALAITSLQKDGNNSLLALTHEGALFVFSLSDLKTDFEDALESFLFNKNAKLLQEQRGLQTESAADLLNDIEWDFEDPREFLTTSRVEIDPK